MNIKFNILIYLVILGLLPTNMLYSQTTEEIINKISDKIWQTSGTLFPKPEIIIFNAEVDLNDIKTLIYYSPKNNNIHISNGFAELCLSIGEEALAIALGHEIGHYFNLHKNTVSISGYYLTENEERIIDELGFEEKTNYYELETQADLFAAFHCFSCGYNVENAWNRLIDTLYSNLGDSITRQTIQDRKKIGTFAIEKVKTLEPVYRTAKYCYLTGEYDMAAKCFEFLIYNNINSTEIYFNLANSYSLAAISTDEQEKKYIYPFEMRNIIVYDSNFVKNPISDTKRNLSGKNRSTDDYKEMMITKALLNYNYLISKLNVSRPELFLAMSVLYNFSGETKSARAYLIKAEELSTTNEQKNMVQLTKGLIYKNIAKDMAELELNKSKDFLPAKHNLDLIRNVSRINEKKQIIRQNENFNNIDLVNFRDNIKEINNFQYDLKGYIFSIKQFINKDFDAIEVENKYGRGLYIQSVVNFQGKTIRNISVGSSVDFVKKQYGIPDNICFYGNSIYYIYNFSKIAFEVQEGKVASWFIYLNE